MWNEGQFVVMLSNIISKSTTSLGSWLSQMDDLAQDHPTEKILVKR
jgi:hypothetical protein